MSRHSRPTVDALEAGKQYHVFDIARDGRATAGRIEVRPDAPKESRTAEYSVMTCRRGQMLRHLTFDKADELLADMETIAPLNEWREVEAVHA